MSLSGRLLRPEPYRPGAGAAEPNLWPGVPRRPRSQSRPNRRRVVTRRDGPPSSPWRPEAGDGNRTRVASVWKTRALPLSYARVLARSPNVPARPSPMPVRPSQSMVRVRRRACRAVRIAGAKCTQRTGVAAQLGSASRFGSGGRRFKSCHPDAAIRSRRPRSTTVKSTSKLGRPGSDQWVPRFTRLQSG